MKGFIQQLLFAHKRAQVSTFIESAPIGLMFSQDVSL